ncbi:MAG TPA: aldehyde dehydrogenase family protein, partial [Erythrobacter sp.]|nr:aldehyde dehydrogenase family protein [Erythrobacter sp.]
MRDCTQFYIDGQWVDPVEENTVAVENPATEETIGHISFGTAADVDKAVVAARRAFESFSQTSKEERLTLLRAIQAEIETRKEELATAVSDEMGAPLSLANGPHVGLLAGHCQKAIEVLEGFAFERLDGPTLHVWEPVGVVGMITPWNWPLNQIACKVFPALATGNTMVLKPSEIAP